MRRLFSLLTPAALTVLTALASSAAARAQHGIVLSGAGPVNRGMGGAATAPLDASGTLYWNPAAIRGLPGSEMDVGVELLYPQSRLASAVAPGALGPGVPPAALAGSDRSDSGVIPVPTLALVYRPEESSWSYGLGLFTAGGFSTNYPASLTNPLLTPQPPRGIGLGVVGAELQVLQLMPTAAYQLTDRLAVGFAPTVDLAHLTAKPALLVPPDDANGDGFPTYPDATQTRYHWGLGFQAGLYYATEGGWHFGASLKSPQWFETFRYQAVDELGRPRAVKVRFDYPLVASVGAAYTGLQDWTFAVDLRYVDYRNTKGFSQTGFDTTGAVRGLGWDSVFVVAAGAQYQLTEALALRLGYSFNNNPIDDALTSFNVASPVILEHTLYAGASYAVTKALVVSVAYAHAFQNAVRGPIVGPLGPIPGTSVQSTVSADTLIAGASVKF
jgi:long-chain fatty acid transport protein